MPSINSSCRPRRAALGVLALLLLAAGVVGRGTRPPRQSHWFEHYFDGTGFDLNDQLSLMSHLRAVHRQEVQVSAESGPTVAGIIKNDDLLPTNLFVTPDIMLNETHPKSESQGYLQVLQAMKYTPVVTPAANATTRDIQAKAGLNGALLKILATTKQFTSSARSSVTSSSVTINQILQNYAALAFGGTYTPFNSSGPVVAAPAVTVVQMTQTPVIGVPVASQALPAEEAEAPETVSVQNNESETVAATPAAEALSEAQTQAVAQAEEQALAQLQAEAPASVASEAAATTAEPTPEQEAEAQIPARLLSLMRMYSEHVQFKDQDFIADEGHYGHLRHFDAHLRCLTDTACDFPKHLMSGAEGSFRSRHTLEAYIANKKDVRSTHAAEFQGEVLSFISSLPSLASNADIKNATGAWITKNQKFLSDFQSAWPGINGAIQDQLANVTATLPTYQNLTPDQFLAILDQLSKSYKAKIDQEFTANGLSNKTDELIEMRTGILTLHEGLRKVIPANGVLDSDFTELEEKLARHIAIFQAAQNASEDQLAAARVKLKNNLQLQINGIDPAAASQLIQGIANDADAILRSDFGKSLNQDNLNFIVQKAINALQVDLDQLHDGKKASNFILDQADLQRLADDVVDELKKGREANQKFILDLRDLNKHIQSQNRLYAAAPASGDPANDAADLLISYENYYYDALSSDDFYNGLKDYIARYYEIYYAHAVPLQPFFNYSAAYKTLTAGLDNPNALGNLNPAAVRLLRGSGALQVAHLASLSDTDKLFFHLLDHLTAEWAITADPVAFNRKLGDVLQAVQGKLSGFRSGHLLQISQEHLLLDIFNNVKNAVMGVISNLGSSATAATNLANTIGYGQTLVKNAADQYQVSDLLTNNGTSTGFLGGLKNKVKGWFGFHNLEVHYGLTDTIASVRNLWGSISEAKNNADKLKTTVGEAQGIANDVQNGINLFNSVVGTNA